MNWREKQLRFSIRKLKVAVASTVIGISVFGMGTPVVQANQILPAIEASAVNYRYVLESELTDAEKNLIQTQLPSHQVGDYSTYYMVYRPTNKQAVANLPLTGMAEEQLVAGLGLGLLIVGVSLVAGKKRRVISSIFFLTAAGAVSVSALGGGSLSVYDRGHQLAVGSTLPETAITIANHEFVGYILEKAALPVAKPTEDLAEVHPTDEAKPEEPNQPGYSTQTEAPIQPVEPSQPVQPTEPSQPEQPTLRVELQDVAFETEVIEDSNLSVGQEVIAQEGRKGQKQLTFKGDQLISEEVIEQPVNRVILRGTKPVEAKEENRLEALPFTTEYQDDPSLAQGEEQVVREGQEGLRQDRYVDGQVVASEVLREPVNRLVKRGTKVDKPAPVESTVYEQVAFETIIESDPTLPLGQEVVAQEGRPGRKALKYLDGQLVSSVVVEAPVAQIIRRGTKVDNQTPVETVSYEDVAFETIVEEDPSLPVGEEVLAQAGQVGRKENKFLDGQLVSSQIVQEPINQIIRKGSRVIEGTVEVSREVELPFDTKIVQDDSQYTDYQVTTPGQNGKATVIDTYRTVNGVQVGLPISSRQETVVEPVAQVLTIGTKPIVDQTRVETLIEVQPDLETRYDENQYEDYNVTTPGQVGQIKRTETYVTVKGEKTGLPLDSQDEILTPATPTLVTIGTKPLEGTVDLSRLVELAFETEVLVDENQYEDFTETIPGTPGQKEIIETFKTLKGEKIGDPIATTEGAVTAPVNAKIVTGTKPIVGSVEETREEVIAFTTETQYDDTKYTDDISEIPGQLGAKILTEAFQTIKGEKVGQPVLKEETVTKAPVNHVIIIGTKPIEGTVLETRTEEYTVEPETRYAENEYEDYSVEIEGTPGTKEITERYQTIKDEKIGLPTVVGEEILVPATPKVFLIGSKAIEGQVTETRTEVIEPDTVIIYDDTKYEDYREEIAGTPGEKEVTETFRTLKGDKTEIVLEKSERTLAEPIAKQIILGRMALAGVESTERIMEVAYVTRLVEDPDQYFGYRKEEGGQPGQTKVYETYQTIKGIRTGEPSLDREEVITAPVDLVVTVGVKPIVATDEDKQVIALPFNTRTAYAADQYTDFREVTPGQDGQLERVTIYRTVRGQRVGEPISTVDTPITSPVEEVIAIGTKPIEGEMTLPPRTEERDFAVERLEDPNQYTDYYHEEGGVKGEVEITETFKTIKGQIEGNPIKSEERVVTAPIKKVITVGTQPLEGQTKVVREEAIPFDTEVKYDNDQYEDYAVETGGTPGKAEVTETYNTFKGEAIGQPTASERVVKEEPVKNIRTVGTKPINWTETVVDKVALPFDTIEEIDADQYEDYEAVRVEGVEGEKTITTVYQTVRGVRQPNPTVTETITKPAVNKVVVKGTKPIYGEETKVRTEPIAFKTREVKDPDQYTDYRKEEGGVEGVKTITEVFKTEKGQVTTELLRSSEEETTAPVEKVITVGTKPIYGEETKVRTEPIAFNTREVTDPDQYTDYRKEEGGVEGVKTITEVFKTEKGQVTTELLRSSEEETTAPVEKVITVGTKPIYGEETKVRTEPIAFNTREVTDPDQYTDYRKEEGGVEGVKTITEVFKTEKGQVTTELLRSSEEETTAPVEKVITVGTKPIYGEETKVRTEPIAFKTREVTDPDQYTDYRKEEGGVEGVKTITEVFKTEKGQVTTELLRSSEEETTAPVEKVITVGTKPIYGEETKVRTEPIAFKTREVTDPDQYTDYRKEEGGVEGVKTITEVFKTEKGQVTTELLRSSEEETTAPVEKVITVGTKPIYGEETKVRTEPIAFKTREVTDPDQYTDYRKEEGGVEGVKTITEVFKTEKGQVTTELLRSSEEETTAPVEKVITVGTKSINDTTTRETTEEVAFGDEIQLDNTKLASSPDEILREGTNGIRTITKTYNTVKGEIVGEAIAESSAITTEPIKRLIKRGTKVLEAEKQEPKAVVQTVAMGAEPIAEQSIQPGLENVRSYVWKEGAKPSTAQSSNRVAGTVIVTYTDGSIDEVEVTIIVRSEADKQTPTAKADKQVVGLNSTPSAEASIETTGLERVRSYTWKPTATPVTTASNPAAAGTVLVTYEDGSVDEVAVEVVVRSEADKQTPTAKAAKQVVGLNSTPDPETSINTTGLERVRSYTWKPGATPVTTASNPAATGTVLVTYEDGSVDEVTVEVVVRSEADKQTPTAKADKQVVGLNSTPDPEASIDTTSLTNVRSYDWFGPAPKTSASIPNATGTVRVTYTDGSYDDVPVSIIVRSEADKQAPTAKADKQVVGLNSTPDPEASINTTGLERVRSYTWKPGATPVTTASNPAATGTVLVTYEDGSVDEVAVDVVVQSDADRQTPRPIVQKVNLKDTPNPEKSIEAGLPTGTSYAWKDGVAPVTTASTMASGQGVAGTVIVTYPDGSKDEVQVTVQVESDADRGNPTPATVKQSVKVEQQPLAADSINKEGLAKAETYEWKTAPDTSAAVTDLDAIVVVTYEDGSKDEVPVRIEVLPNKTKPTLVLEKLTELDDDKKINLNYELTDPTNAKTSITYEIYNGTEKVKEGIVDSNNPFDVDGLDWNIPYTLKTILTYDLGQGPVVETLEDVPFELEYKKLEIKDVDSLSLYRLENGQFVKQAMLSGEVADTKDYFVRITSDRFRDMLLPVRSIQAEGAFYRVTTDIQELVEDKDASANSDYQDQFSFLVKKAPTDPKIFTTFRSLVEAMRLNPTGEFIIGAELNADDMTVGANDTAYVTADFRGTLTGLSEGQQNAITNLKIPLFNKLIGGRVSNLDLKNVAINTTRSNVGTVANEATGNSRLTDISVQGSLTASHNIGGLVYNNVETVLDNTSFTGRLTATATSGDGFNGGLVGVMTRGTIQNSYVNADITVTANSSGTRTGGIIGFNNNGFAGASFTGQNVQNVYTEGSLTNKGTAGQTGGIIGSNDHTHYPGRLKNVVNKMTVTNGNPVYGTATIRANSISDAYTTTGTAQQYTTSLTPEDATNRQNAMGITTSLNDSIQPDLEIIRSTDYTTLPKAIAERKTAYENIEKLMPFYHKELVVKYGNLVDSASKLYTTKLLSVTPMKDNAIVSDVNSVKTGLNKLMLHYADNTIGYLDVTYTGDFKNAAVSEYAISGTKLIYTPEQFLSSYDALIAEVLPTLKAVEYKSSTTATVLQAYTAEELEAGIVKKMNTAYPRTADFALTTKALKIQGLRQLAGMTAAAAEAQLATWEQEFKTEHTTAPALISTQMDKLYLEPTFDKVKENLESLLKQVLSTDKSVNTTGGIVDTYLADYIKDNKEKLLMGLAYMTRWYNIDFKDTNIKDLATFHQDFFGQKQVNTLEWLVELGSSYERLAIAKNLDTYKQSLAANTGKANLTDYLTANRTLFTDYIDDNTWFKDTTTAYVYEGVSKHVPQSTYDTRVYSMLNTDRERNGILPLLTAREGIYIMTNMGGISYGMFDRYYSGRGQYNDATPPVGLSLEEQKAYIRQMVDRAGKRQVDHFDAWYRLAPADVRDKVMRTMPMPTWDGYNVNGVYLPKEGAGANDAILDFFGPVGARSTVTQRGIGAYANGTSIYFVIDRLLDSYGSSVYTHEAVHNNDGAVYLGGFGRRPGAHPEYWALGLLQSSSYPAQSATFLTLNLMFDYEAHKDSATRYTNLNPERFQSSADLKTYMHGIFDVLYTLDYAEATIAATLSTASKRNLYGVMGQNISGVHATSVIRTMSESEAAALTDWEKFIDGNIVGRREYDPATYAGDGYNHSYMFTPTYAALANNTGSPGILMFKRMAFELMADKGYEEGFIPYTSGKLKTAANDVVTDEEVLRAVYGTTYNTWADFKKAMFQERIAKRDNLSAITITYLGRQEQISSYADIERLMTEAMTYDSTRPANVKVTATNSRVHALKAAIYNAYLRQTDDFRTSIYN